MNILLLGTDARIGEDISRTDALILVHLDGQTERVSILLVPARPVGDDPRLWQE